MKKYFIHNDSTSLGPFTIDELKDMEITKYTPVWYEGMGDWLPAAQIKELETLWSDDQPFVYYSAPPPQFDKDVYENIVKNGLPTQLHQPSRFGSTAFRIGFVALVVIVVGVVAYRYHIRTVDQTYTAALEQRKWEDSINKHADTSKQVLASSDSSTTDLAYEADRSENAKNYVRMNIDRFVRCSKSFDVKRLGGIQNVRVVVYNNSDFPINRADIRLAYIKSSGDVFTTHDVSVLNIPAHGHKEINAPDEKRGSDLKGMLTKVSSTELGLAKNMSVKF